MRSLRRTRQGQHAHGVGLFVFGGIPGEVVEAEVVRVRRRYVAARVVAVHEPSPHRVSPPCPYFWPCTGCQWQHIAYEHQLMAWASSSSPARWWRRRWCACDGGTSPRGWSQWSPHRVSPPCPYFWPCTGCQWQHIAYEHQLTLKREMVRDTLSSVPELADVQVLPVIPSAQQYGYRNHARFTVGPKGSLGYVNRTSREFVRVESCQLMDPWINGALASLSGRCQETSQLSIRYGVNTGEWLIQPRLLSMGIPIATGQTHYHEAVDGRRYRIASPSFFQVNTPQAQAMAECIRGMLGLEGSEVLVDAYAGVGTFAGLLASQVGRVIAIEESAAALRDARFNLADLPNVELRQGRVEALLASLEPRPDVVLVDPPRAGCHPRALEALCELAPRKVVYVSCEPKALARDLQHLVAGPFRVEQVQPIDLFPQTHHIECIATLGLAGEEARP